jgi:hypothetical protein
MNALAARKATLLNEHTIMLGNISKLSLFYAYSSLSFLSCVPTSSSLFADLVRRLT